MREFSHDLSKMFSNGLRPEARLPMGAPGLQTCEGMKPLEGVLAESGTVVNPFGTLNVVWPFPQLFRGKKNTYLCISDNIFIVDETTVPWGLTQITVWKQGHVMQQSTIPAGGCWHFIDFYDTVMFFNGACVVFRANTQNMVGCDEKWIVAPTPKMNAGCSFLGRAIYGGFSDGFFGPDWKALITLLTERTNPGLKINFTLEQNFIFWTNAGGGDLVWPFIPLHLVHNAIGTNTVDSPVFLDFMQANACGFMPIPYQGTILAMKPLGRNLIVYSENGVAVVTSHSEPTTTLAVDMLLPMGIAGRGAVGGDGREHVFLDNSGVLWRLSAGLDLQRLGYKEFLLGLLGREPVISLDPNEREFYIGGPSGTFILTERGLGESSQHVTSLCYAQGGLLGPTDDPDGDVLLETHPFDFGTRSIKTLYGIHVGHQGLSQVEVRLSQRFQASDEWEDTDWRPLNKEGVVTFVQSGVEFKVWIRATASRGATLDWVKSTVKYPDRRYARALDASSTNS